MIIVGGRIVTRDNRHPEAEAIAIAEGVVLAIGTRQQIEAYRSKETRVVDIAGGVATPGLTDAHAHLLGLGAQLETVDLRGAASIEEVVAKLQAQPLASEWVIGRGWDQNLWPIPEPPEPPEPAEGEGQLPEADPEPDPHGRMPSHAALTAAFPDRPVWLRRVDGHAAWCNTVVLERAGITAETKDPKGGEILRDAEGNPTGVLIDAAMGLVEVPKPTREDLRRQLLAAQAHVLARGISGIHEMGVSKDGNQVFEELEKSGELKLRIHGYADRDWFEAEVIKGAPKAPTPEQRYALAGVKVYVDGALGSRGAALSKAYSDRKGHRGALMDTPKNFERVSRESLEKGWQVASHAIGDRGNRTILTAYAKALQRHDKKGHRFRIEHAQIVDPGDIASFAQLGVVASMQPTHATSDMPWVPDRVGESRTAGAYAWRRFLKAGTHLALGSDFPVERADITHGIHAAVTRQDAAGNPAGGWLPDQRLTLDEAIQGFTSEAAYAAHREDHLGKLKKGYQADLTIFAEDLWKMEPAQLRDAEIRAVVVGGELVWEAGSQAN
jgi:predicted amidohydrolase YtcJ